MDVRAGHGWMGFGDSIALFKIGVGAGLLLWSVSIRRMKTYEP